MVGTVYGTGRKAMKLRNTLDAMECTINELASYARNNLSDEQAHAVDSELALLRLQLKVLTDEFASERPKRFVRTALA